MAYFEFDESLKVGNKLIDQEHAVLIDYINLLQTSVENEVSERLLTDVLEGLVEYTKTHFFVEEEIMKAYEYPDSEAHKLAHKLFKEKIEGLDLQSDDKDMAADLLAYLKDWLTTHILKIDKKFADFLKDKSMAG